MGMISILPVGQVTWPEPEMLGTDAVIGAATSYADRCDCQYRKKPSIGYIRETILTRE